MDKYSILKEYFGHDSFREGQEEIINHILSGRDVFGIMPTGAGKSVCYQVPAMLMEGITIVISPLISLMKDQVNSLVSAGIPTAYINSSLTMNQYNEVFRRAYSGAYKIIYIAPERLATEEFISFAERVKISMITVDEAHCVSQWGQDFRPSYRKIREFTDNLSYRPVISAFTATATSEVRDDIINLLNLNNPFVMTTSFNRKNLFFSVIKPNNKYLKLKELLDGYQGKCGIIYCISRKNVEEICQKLNDDGFSATRYHAGLSDTERRENQDDFIYDRKMIMVATNAFGMGIDKSNVSFVIHYNMPKNPESYYQEAGRAGRDGEQADCILLYSGTDVRTNQFLIENSREENQELTPEELDDIRQRDYARLKAMTIYSTTTDCLREYMLRYFGEKLGGPCGNCSTCLGNYEITDVTVEAQKIISCVYRIHQKGQHFGKQMVTDVLLGSKSERVKKYGFDSLSTYNIMSGTKRDRIYKITDYLTENGFLILTDDEFPTLRLSALSASVLKGEKNITMKLPREEKKSERKQTEKEYFADSQLFEKLRTLRNSIAKKEGVPAYIIFSDSALKDMCRKQPTNIDDFLNVSGVGRVKAERFGEEFCSLIAEYVRENPDEEKPPESENNYLENQLSKLDEMKQREKNVPIYHAWTEDEDKQLRDEIKQGMNMAQIASAHNRSISEIALRIKKL